VSLQRHQRFVGTFTPRMDDKGRVTVPAKYRPVLEDGVVISRGQDHCLYVFTPEGFDTFAQDAIDAPVTDPKARGYQRMLLANADEQQPDGQGRITIPARMREYARLRKDVVITGVGSRMEIWDAEEWTRYEREHEETFAAPERGLLG
jgi:MraZ protein